MGRTAAGEWLCFLDADDELAPGYLEAMTRAFEQERGGATPLALDGSPFLLTPAVQYVRRGRPGRPQFNDRGIPLTDDNWLIVGTLIQKKLFLEVGRLLRLPTRVRGLVPVGEGVEGRRKDRQGARCGLRLSCESQLQASARMEGQEMAERHAHARPGGAVPRDGLNWMLLVAIILSLTVWVVGVCLWIVW